ncbi:hypothetical protein NHJ76_004544 [Salmonella enterica]|nr:hypothetical protein [Salmonella enterica]EJJ0427144.1 hypothetical protein [Salmonella enterica]
METWTETKRLRADAKYRGKVIFQHTVKCGKCGTYECYTNKPKGRGCVQCDRQAKAKYIATNAEAVKLAKREYNNRNRPSHNPEQVLFNGLRRAGFIQAGVSSDQEWLALQNKCELLKLANGTEGGFTLDHIEPAAGFFIDGVKHFGKTVAENLRLETVERNKAKAGMRMNDELDLTLVTVKPSDAINIDRTTSTEEMRSAFYNAFGINTKPNCTYNAGERLDAEKDTKFTKEALSEPQAMRAATVLEILMAGRADLLKPSEKNPLPWYWDEEAKRKVQKQIVVIDGLHSPETLAIAQEALNWFDSAMHQVRMAKGARADWCADFATRSPFGEIFYQPDIVERIERHFVEWATGWFMKIDREKPLFDFIGLVDKKTLDSWFWSKVKEADLRSAVNVADGDLQKAQRIIAAGSDAYGHQLERSALTRKTRAEEALNQFIAAMENLIPA